MKSKTIDINFQEKEERKTMGLFREGFELEKKSSSQYMKLQKGDNKFRILSAFVDGWEEWDENRKPIRSLDKPEVINEGTKQFVAAIVWNYNEKKIQILQLTQSTIIKALSNFADDEDWGPVFFYDIKIVRSGEDKLTKYSVNPLPHKPLTPDIEKAFKEKPCNLDALFVSGDPFGQWDKYTPGVFSQSDLASGAKKIITISEEEADELLELIGSDFAFMKTLKARLKSLFGSEKITDIPANQLPKIKEAIYAHFDNAKAV